MNRRQLLIGLAGGAVVSPLTVRAEPIRAYEALVPICAGCGAHLAWVERVRPTEEPQPMLCVRSWCERHLQTIAVQRFRKLA